MFGRWKSRRGGSGDTSPAPEAAPRTGPGDAWAALPPVQRVLAPPQRVADPSFSTALATHADPSFQRELGHGRTPSAPSGLLLDAVRVLPDRPTGTELPAVRLPVTAPEGAREG
ncbi:hypothetical protein ACWGI1_35380, partial [Streptomyces sp. NPDC054835]